MALSTLSRSSKVCAAQRPAVAPRCVRVVRCQAADSKKQLLDLAKPLMTAVAANAIMALPAAAEAGKIFDFNLTLPIMAGEFLLLMVFLDKAWFTPVGKVLDERDALIRDKLASVKDNTTDVDKLLLEAETLLKEARSAVSSDIAAKKNAKQAELDKVYNEAKAKIQKETDAAIAGLEVESGAVLKALDAKVDTISSEVLKRVLPEGVRI